MTFNSTFKPKNDKPMLRTQFGRTRMKKKVCKICKEDFETSQPLAIVCSPTCAIGYANLQREEAKKRFAKLDRAKDKKRKEALKSRNEWIADVQVSFNRMIRARDAGKPCIDCGKQFEPQKPGGSADAGHYISRGAAPHLRFNENNCFAQRKNCNRPGGTTREKFRAGVIARIGIEAVEALESDQSSPKWTIDELKEMKKEFNRRANEYLKSGKHNDYT